jgi:hypothetical protein
MYRLCLIHRIFNIHSSRLPVDDVAEIVLYPLLVIYMFWTGQEPYDQSLPVINFEDIRPLLTTTKERK